MNVNASVQKEAPRSQRMARMGAWAFAAGGVSILAVVLASTWGVGATEHNARPSVPETPPAPLLNLNSPRGGNVLPDAPPAGGVDQAPDQDDAPGETPKPKATSGPLAIVRWKGACAQGLGLLEEQKGAEALAWGKAHENVGARARLIQARALVLLKRFDEAEALFKTCAQGEFPIAVRADAAFGSALCAAGGEAGKIPVAALDKLIQNESDSWGFAMAALERATRYPRAKNAGAEDDEEARRLLQNALETEDLELPAESVCFEQLSSLTSRIIANPNQPEDARPKAVSYTVEAGDSLTKIAKRYGVPISQLCRMNGLDAKAALIAGKTLKALPGEVTLRVDASRLTLTLYIDGIFIKRAPVCIGPAAKTPRGTFSIKTKLVNPDWYYNSKRYAFGDPENQLGTRWMGFDPEENGGAGAGIGIHGTNKPESIPGRESLGCIRVQNENVEEIFDFVPQGAKVNVED